MKAKTRKPTPAKPPKAKLRTKPDDAPFVTVAKGVGKSHYVAAIDAVLGRLPADKDFGRMVRDAIRASGVSQYAIGKATGIPQPSISQFLSGSDLRLDTFSRLAAFMGFDLRQDAEKAPRRITGDDAALPDEARDERGEL